MDIKIITEKLIDFLPHLALLIATLIIGFWVINKVIHFLKASLHKFGIDETIAPFLTSIASVGMKVMLLLSVAAKFGINTTSFVAMLGALLVGVGMALNGTIGHFASGVMLLIFKPFKVGDLVEVGGGHKGTVEAINAFNTTLLTLDNKKIIVSNSNITDNTITNISGQGTVGVELTFGIGYNDSIDEARKIILAVGASCPYILKDPAQGVVVAELADSSVNLASRPFVNSEHYWDTYFYMQENVKKQFDLQGISIPYPQIDIHQN